MSKKIKFSLAATLQLGLIASIGDFVGWPYMNYIFGLAVGFFILTLLFIIYEVSKD